MLATWRTSRITPAGIDLGTSAVRGAQLRRTPDGFAVARLGHLDRPEGAGDAREGPGERLRKLWAQAAFSGRSLVTAMNPPEVEFHVLDVPAATLQGPEAEKVVQFEIGRLTSLSTQDIETRHWVLPAHPGPSATAIGLSVRRQSIADLLSVCSRHRLQCQCVETGATALHRFGWLLRPWAAEEIWGVLDLGATHSRLILCNGDVPLLIRQASDGGAAWTQRIAEGLELSPAAAEIQKKNHGIALLGRKDERSAAAAAGATDEVAVMLLGILRGELNDMAAEIKRSYEYVLNCYPGRRAADLVLVGGGARMPNLPEFLSGILGIPVRRCGAYLGQADSRLQLPAAAREPLESYATAIGLALAEAIP